ncbi:MAG TPA: 6,7-dimethyl-8-ribityllumazine synthase [Acidimicrobiaceae bacterium]|nr:6,7-dimethyl-8-ribityllumazine synthase [Acidimicrobiaceae bacterium]HCB37058.1 6,7-dimethyl-8-ribityllumazine synthase [Acidimicrobiaceae bacterium]
MVNASWHPAIVKRLVDGAMRCAEEAGVLSVIRIGVPGCFELPRGCQAVANMGVFHAIAAIGVLVRGETPHFDLVSQSAAAGLQRVQLDTRVPIGFGLLAVENEQQAIERSRDDNVHNVGYDAMRAALVMSQYDEVNLGEGMSEGIDVELARHGAPPEDSTQRRWFGRRAQPE